MKKTVVAIGIVCLLSSLFFSTAYSQEDVNSSFRRLRSGLLNSKVPLKDVNMISPVLRDLLNQGAERSVLSMTVTGLAGRGVSGSDLEACLQNVSDLIKYGVPVSDSCDVVLEGIDKGLVLGFKGGDIGLIDEVKKAVKAKKQSLDKTKNNE